MLKYVKKLLLCVSLGVLVGFAENNCAAQSSGPATLAAKQTIKNKVLSAMADKKITESERQNILEYAKDVLTDKEYAGLVRTMNRLSPPEYETAENQGVVRYVDKQLMANFPTPEISFIEKGGFSKSIAETKESIVSNFKYYNEFAPREVIVKQTIVNQSAPKQSVAKTSSSKKTAVAAKSSAAKQPVVKATAEKKPATKARVAASNATKEAVAKTTKQPAAAKVVILAPPPEPQTEVEEETEVTTVSQTEDAGPKLEAPALPTPPTPPAKKSVKATASADKPAKQTDGRKVAEAPKKTPTIEEQASIQQPGKMLNEAETPTLKTTYRDYSVPVLNTPAAAFLNERKIQNIKASFEQTLEPDESSQSIVRR
jgi:hypothetical protein